MTPHKCPICRGNGIVPKGFYTATGDSWISDGTSEACRACVGKGIIWEPTMVPISSQGSPVMNVHTCEFGTSGLCLTCGFIPETK